MNTRHPLHLSLLLLLAACSNGESHNNPAPQPDFRQTFIQACTESAANSPLPKATLAQLCACTHDQAAASYGSPAQWQQAMSDYDHKRGDPTELEKRIRQAGEQCQAQFAPPTASNPTTP